MAEGSLTLDELRSRVGVDWEPLVHEIEKGMIQQFVRAIDDPNPMWQEIAPPTFVWTIGLVELMEQISSVPDFVNFLNGGTELEWYQPIRPGDVVTAVTKIADIRERQGKMGKLLFMTFETTYKNQRQELVARCHDLAIGSLG